MKSMRGKWMFFLLIHICGVLAAGGFFAYAILADRFLPQPFFHCLLHDVFHLYCPFCGGTRAVRALSQFRLPEAIGLCPTALPLLPVLATLDLRAFVILCRKKEQPLFPPRIWQWMLAFLIAGTVLRDTLMLFGLDFAGELGLFWQGRLSGTSRVIACFLIFLAGVALYAAIYEGKKSLSPHGRIAVLFLAAGLGVSLLAVLYSFPWMFLFFLPIGGAGAMCFRKMKVQKGGS